MENKKQSSSARERDERENLRRLRLHIGGARKSPCMLKIHTPQEALAVCKVVHLSIFKDFRETPPQGYGPPWKGSNTFRGFGGRLLLSDLRCRILV